MQTFDDLLAPLSRGSFGDRFDDREPLHIPADANASKRTLLDWPRFNLLLDQASNWTAQSLKLVINGEPVPSEAYCLPVQTQSGMVFRPSPARVQSYLAKGASLIVNDAQHLTPGLRSLSTELAEHFGGLVGVNLYCSFGGVQAFRTHYDLSHVFAIQMEGEKTWRLHANRADAPIDFPEDAAAARAHFEAGRGPLLREVVMRPGDVLYLPRGWHHDALTEQGASLHVTMSVTPLYGRVLFRLLESAAMQNPAFRAWLAPANRDDGKLKAQVADLGRYLARLTELPSFVDEVAMAQERLVPRHEPYDLPNAPRQTAFQRTGAPPPNVRGPARIAMDWAFHQPRFCVEDLLAQYDFVPPADVWAAVHEAERSGALRRVTSPEAVTAVRAAHGQP